MAPQNRLDVVERIAQDYPQDFDEAHHFELGDRAWIFIRRLAYALHQTDRRWGMNGRRGNPNDLSADATPYRGGPDASGGVFLIDVIAGAGGRDPQPAWFDVTQATIDAGTIGIWVQPEPVDGSPPAPTPAPTPDPPDGLDARRRAIIEAAMGRHDPAGAQFVHRVAYAASLEDSTIGQKRAAVDRPISDTTVGVREPDGLRAIAIVRRDGITDWRDYGIVGPEQVWVVPTPIDINGPVPPELDPPDPTPDPPAPTPPSGSIEDRVATLEARVSQLASHIQDLNANQFATVSQLGRLKATLRSV